MAVCRLFANERCDHARDPAEIHVDDKAERLVEASRTPEPVCAVRLDDQLHQTRLGRDRDVREFRLLSLGRKVLYQDKKNAVGQIIGQIHVGRLNLCLAWIQGTHGNLTGLCFDGLGKIGPFCILRSLTSRNDPRCVKTAVSSSTEPSLKR